MTEDRKRAPTIVDVAERAGAAIGTVSRFLNGETVRSADRDQIERAIAGLGYQRNAAAVAMKTDETWIVGFMAPSPGNSTRGFSTGSRAGCACRGGRCCPSAMICPADHTRRA